MTMHDCATQTADSRPQAKFSVTSIKRVPGGCGKVSLNGNQSCGFAARAIT